MNNHFINNISTKCYIILDNIAERVISFYKKRPKTTLFLILFFIFYAFCLPNPLFNDPTCMVLEDNNDNLLGAKIAKDGQWRFPYNDTIPEKYVRAVVEFEDRHFFFHPGIDPMGILRAIKQNFIHKKIISGGSTLTMQIIRMARKGQARTIWEKLIEFILATRAEIRYSKRELMSFYASNAPFGGNVVGLDAASWRYFGKAPRLLSWAEAATLAVLPNSPAMIHPGRHRDNLLAKRNRLLERLREKGDIDATTCELAKEESLPEKPLALPRLAPHLLDSAFEENFKGKKNLKTRLKTTLNANLQAQVNTILQNHHLKLEANGIHNLAAMILDIEKNTVVAYVGNIETTDANIANEQNKVNLEHGEQVDIIRAPRSSGSIFKPLLFSMMLNEGEIIPESLIPDIPTQMGSYKPENFYETYDGVTTAKRALIRSLNVPFVRLLQDYSVEKFHLGLQKMGISTLHKSPKHYGLTLILGGAETSLWDITNVYAGLARTVNHFGNYNSRYFNTDFQKASYQYSDKEKQKKIKNTQPLKDAPFLSASACYLTLDAMQQVERPTSTGEWEVFQSSKRIAWKTGTSFGFRDAWAVGVTPRYAVGVWVGNADGEGRPDLVGVTAAAPILFDIFNQLPSSEWFSPPYDDMIQMPICRQSGYRPTNICDIDTVWVAKNAVKVAACPYHQIIHLDDTATYQVNSDCESPTKMRHQPFFVLPPVEEFYFKSKNPNYKPLPPFRNDCIASLDATNPMQLIYPRPNTQIYVPIDFDGKPSKAIFKAAHRNPKTLIYWHLDGEFISTTQQFHSIELRPSLGKHHLVLVDALGNRTEITFQIL